MYLCIHQIMDTLINACNPCIHFYIGTTDIQCSTSQVHHKRASSVQTCSAHIIIIRIYELAVMWPLCRRCFRFSVMYFWLHWRDCISV